METKGSLRAKMRELRNGMTPESLAAIGKSICRYIIDTPTFKNADALLLYAPVGNEVSVLYLVKAAENAGIRVAFPRCLPNREMEFRYLDPAHKLAKGSFGIPEPPETAELCRPTERTLLVVPGLAFAHDGSRLGRGGGYYDGYLKDFPGATFGVAPSFSVLEELPTEAHDVPVSFLISEQGFWRCIQPRALEPIAEEEAPAPQPVPSEEEEPSHLYELKEDAEEEAPPKKVSPFLATLKSWFSKSLHLPPVLVSSVFLLLFLSQWIEDKYMTRDNEWFLVILLQVCTFLVPAVVYLYLQHDYSAKRLKMRPVRASHVWLCVCFWAVMVSGGLLLSILTGGVSSLSEGFSLYDTFRARVGDSTGSLILAIFAYAVLPAFSEELIFRSILIADYEGRGVAIAVAVSSLLFAMLHGSFSLFLAYLFLGAILGLAVYTTKSFLAVFFLHFCYNLFCLFGQPYLSAFYINAGSTEIFLFLLTVVFLLFSAFAVGEARKVYHIYAVSGFSSDYTVDLHIRDFPLALIETVFTPGIWISVLFFLFSAIRNLF